MTSIFLLLLGVSVSTGLMVAVLLFLTPFLNQRYAAKWKYLIWIFLSLRLLVPFSGLNGPFFMDLLSQPAAQTVSETEEKNTDTFADLTIPYRRIVVEIPAQMTAPIHAPSEKGTFDITMLDVVTFVWIIGSLLFISIHLISYFHLKRQVMKHGTLIKDISILSPMWKLKRELQIRRPLRIMEYHKAESPMILGFFRPVLVLPKEHYNAEELFFILKHELVHLKRGDVYFKLLFATANAVHWFNPLIWILQKEAVVDMELSCDERVTQGTSYAVRKAYTETLLSMLHKRCIAKTALSTQFYGGTKIMKKRFKKILTKNGKKNGISVLIIAVILTISFGTLVGCSIAEEHTRKENTESENTERENTERGSDQSDEEAVFAEPMSYDDSSAENQTLKNTTILAFSKEGEQELKQATLAIGDGYSLYLPDGEWQQSDSDMWTAAVNDQIQLWVTHFEGESKDSVIQKLEEDGYTAEEGDHKWKQEGDFLYHVELKASEHDVWGIFYSYPTDSEEGWGRDLPVIADTFALSVNADAGKNNSPDESGE